MFGAATVRQGRCAERDDERVESRWYYLGGFLAAAFFAGMMWLMVGPIPALIGFVFIGLVAIAPMLRRR